MVDPVSLMDELCVLKSVWLCVVVLVDDAELDSEVDPELDAVVDTELVTVEVADVVCVVLSQCSNSPAMRASTAWFNLLTVLVQSLTVVFKKPPRVHPTVPSKKARGKLMMSKTSFK